MRRGNSDMHKNRKHDDVFLRLYKQLLRCGKAMLGKLLYKLCGQHLVRMPGRPGGERVRRMCEAGLLQQLRLRRGETVC